MSKNDAKPVGKEGELTDKQLDGIAGGQEVKKMGTIVVTAKREQPANDQVVKMEKITVTAKATSGSTASRVRWRTYCSSR